MATTRPENKQTSMSSKTSQSGRADPHRWAALTCSTLIVITLPAMLALVSFAKPAAPTPAWSAEAVSLGVLPLDIAKGELTYLNSCAMCHGQTGDGVHLMGKPVRNSAFVQSQTDDELLGLLIHGRPINDPQNTSGALMPPRGARELSDEQLESVALYLRAIQDENAPTASTEAWNLKGREGGATVAAVTLEEHPGFELFVASCSACHGEGAEGIENQGLPLTTSGFIRGSTDKALITFIKSGRPIWDANNTTGIDMPPKGGNPAITDEQLQQIVDYIRAVQTEATGG